MIESWAIKPPPQYNDHQWHDDRDPPQHDDHMRALREYMAPFYAGELRFEERRCHAEWFDVDKGHKV